MGSDYRVLQQAAEWFALLQSGSVSASERRAWAAWLEQPEHAQAWAKVERISGQFQPLTSDAIGRAAGAMLQQRQSTRRQALKCSPSAQVFTGLKLFTKISEQPMNTAPVCGLFSPVQFSR